MLFEIPVGFLDQLTGKHEAAREAVTKMAADKRSYTRHNVIMCIGAVAPEAFKLNLLRQGLRDKNSKFAGRRLIGLCASVFKNSCPNLKMPLQQKWMRRRE